MYPMKFKITLLSLLLSSSIAIAQNVVKGTITDATDGEPLVGVTVILDGTTTGTSTDLDGKFSLDVRPKQGVLNISYIGYESVKLPFISNADEYQVLLNPETSEIDEIVVVGYGVQKKSHLTGSISKYDGEKLADIPVSNLDQALQGRIAGVNIQNTDQEAGAAAQIRIRGMGSISASSDPLIVVDGFPIADGMQFLNMSDVESVEVLKDAASAAIYGSRGANGVIMITTKSGNAAKPKYSVSAFTGIKSVYKTYDVMNSVEYLDMLYDEARLREISNTEGIDDDFTRFNLASSGERAAYVLEKKLGGTDWQKEALRSIATINNVQFSVSGGIKDLKYYVSGNYSRDEGIMKNSLYDKFNFRAKIDANLSKNLKFGINLSPNYTMKESPSNNFTDFYRWYSFSPAKHTQASADFINNLDPSRNIKVGDWAQVLDFASLPYEGVMPDGTYWNSLIDGISDADRYPSPSTSANNNPLSVMNTQSRKQYGYRLQASAYLQWEPIKNLILRTSNGIYTNYQENEGYINKNSAQEGNDNQATYTSKLTLDFLSENTANYIFSIGKHDFTALAGMTFQNTSFNTAGISGIGFPNDLIHTLNGATVLNLDGTYTRKEKEILISYLGRVNWSYNEKYLASVSFRADGSSKFKNKKWGYFPSVSAGWLMSNESFMDVTKDWLKMLKLRASFGVTGNNDIARYAYTDLLYTANYVFGETGMVVPGLANTSDAFANPYLSWEQTNEYNIGLDAAFLNNRITLGVDYYYAITRKMLFKPAAMSHSGHNEAWNNIGKVRNNGIEIEISSNNITTKDFTWKTSLNFALNRNRLLELGGEALQYSYGERNEVYAAIVGDPAIQFFGYKTDGVWKSQEEINSSGIDATKSSVPMTLGGLKVVDTNGDGVLTPEDRVPLGSPFADFTWGLGNNFTWRDFDLSFTIQGSQGGHLINGDIYYNESKKYNRAYNQNRWVSSLYPGDGKTPYMANGVDQMLTDYVMESATYVALRDVIIGYTLPKNVLQKINMRSLRVYVSMQNLLYFMGSGYRGLNPEARTTSGEYASPLVNGYQRGAFPLNRTFSFGIDLTF